jgi:hypothetical protein
MCSGVGSSWFRIVQKYEFLPEKRTNIRENGPEFRHDDPAVCFGFMCLSVLKGLFLSSGCPIDGFGIKTYYFFMDTDCGFSGVSYFCSRKT